MARDLVKHRDNFIIPVFVCLKTQQWLRIMFSGSSSVEIFGPITRVR
jgi:hypothetical protein